ncbi:minor capsid protein L2 [Psittacus erithacus papillomavirus 1]|uniref:Minor capsid protein L2 n=2 Tax=Psittacus erithacus timneh papillomavirus TaxID=197772 RepID=Q8JJG4_PEPVA|nr:minor capsid protein L2 [Psittacus erithacus papillomavirus 1]AAM46856.1 minor capsid protein L2 [Psittacus erithacus papillomavirus 1]AAM75204.1 putative minor capsid protein L2 [Thetapapillomavirus 1]
MVAYRRFLLQLPVPPTSFPYYYGPRFLLHSAATSSSLSSTVSPSSARTISRRRRAAADDLWRKCQYGDCPDDVRQRYTQTTIADKILQWGSALAYLGGLAVGTGRGGGGVRLGSGASAVPRPTAPDTTIPFTRPVVPDSAAAVPEGGIGTVPADRPFQVPTANVPVDVVPVSGTEHANTLPPNTFVNPAFEGDLDSSSSIDSVVIGDLVRSEDAPRTRGDTFIMEHEFVGPISEERRPYFPTLNSNPTQPFEEIEMVTFGSTADEDSAIVGREPSTSTPVTFGTRGTAGRPRGYTLDVTISNPVYDEALDIDRLFQEGLQEWVDSDIISPDAPGIPLGDPSYATASFGTRLQVSRPGQLPGIRLRSGRRLQIPVLFTGDLSSIAPDLELQPLQPVGATGTVVSNSGAAETVFSAADTIGWDGQNISASTGIIDIGPVSGDDLPFFEIPLDDPFPEMEIVEESETNTTPYTLSDISVVDTTYPFPAITSAAYPSVSIQEDGGIVVYPTPAAPVSYGGLVSMDPNSLFWFLLRRRRRRRRTTKRILLNR